MCPHNRKGRVMPAELANPDQSRRWLIFGVLALAQLMVVVDATVVNMAVFDRLVAVNLKGKFMGCKHAIPHMLARGGGSIVNTASVDGFVGRGVRAAYGASKAG